MPDDTPSPPGAEVLEATVRRLRRGGHSRLEAVRVILDVLGLSLSEAKELLLTSDTWADARNEVEADEDEPFSDEPPPAPG
jgi:ribosomal protein L7/L12